MTDKLSAFIDSLTEEELDRLDKSLRDGSIEKHIEIKKEYFKIKDKTCPVCGSIVQENCLVLIFGDPAMRKKAHFCGIDCMEYFMNNFIKKTQKIMKRKNERIDYAAKTIKSNI